MPTRQQSRAETRTAYIANERRLNHIERALEAKSAALSPTTSIDDDRSWVDEAHPTDPDDPPPF